MRKFKLNLLLTTFVLLCSIIIVSCSDKNEKKPIKGEQNAFFLQMEDRFNEAGISNILDNYTLSKKEYTLLSPITKDINAKQASFKTEYFDGSVVYAFMLPDEKYFTVKVSDGKIVKSFQAKMLDLGNTNELVIFKNDKLERSYTFAKTGNRNIIGVNTENATYSKRQADCDELGGRRNGESFGDCFKRNWHNFCCDFIGCAAQISNPQLVAFDDEKSY